ncbi:hypothetical protein J1614_008913 [Plenodomus biglobosus]|nr:hypothetical protein J1614_008913 [Plenodomus biglobosus]
MGDEVLKLNKPDPTAHDPTNTHVASPPSPTALSHHRRFPPQSVAGDHPIEYETDGYARRYNVGGRVLAGLQRVVSMQLPMMRVWRGVKLAGKSGLPAFPIRLPWSTGGGSGNHSVMKWLYKVVVSFAWCDLRVSVVVDQGVAVVVVVEM